MGESIANRLQINGLDENQNPFKIVLRCTTSSSSPNAPIGERLRTWSMTGFIAPRYQDAGFPIQAFGNDEGGRFSGVCLAPRLQSSPGVP